VDAIGYFRQPAAKGDLNELTLSLQEQEQQYFRFCRSHGYQPVATFIDPATGPESSRGFRQLRNYLAKPDRGFIVVVLSALGDLSPKPAEVVERVLDLEQAGAQLATVAGEPEGDWLVAALDYWRERKAPSGLSARAMDALRNKAMRGYGLGKTPYGYCIGSHGRLEVVPEEAAVVRRIYKMYLEEGLGLRLIARRLNDENIATRRSKRWSVVTVRDILRNRTYTGTYARFGVRITGSHEAIVSTETYREAQHKREGAPTVQHGAKEHGFALSGLAYCGSCGGRMIGVRRTQSWARKRDGGRSEATYRYYRCGSRVNQSVCSYHTWRTDDLEQAVLQAIGTALDGAAQASTVVPATELRALVSGRLKVLGTRFARYLEGTTKGTHDAVRLRRLSYPLLREQHRLQVRLQDMDAVGGREALQAVWWQQQRERWSDLMTQWPALADMDRRLALGDLVRRVTVSDGKVEPELMG
jgi:site-specific DNA recombinase